MAKANKLWLVAGSLLILALGTWGFVSTNYFSSFARGWTVMVSSPAGAPPGAPSEKPAGHGARQGGPGAPGAHNGAAFHQNTPETFLAGAIQVLGYAAILVLVTWATATVARWVRFQRPRGAGSLGRDRDENADKNGDMHQ